MPPNPRIKAIAALAAEGRELGEISQEVGLSEATIQALMSSDIFRALQREELLRGRLGDA